MLSKVKKNSGFTLIELLIVIVIIGILAGVAISVIDPKKQQDRAHDASIKATMNKVALSTEGYVSAYGEAPPPKQFIEGLKNVKEGHTCIGNGTDDVECVFQIEGNPLPPFCNDEGWQGLNPEAGVECFYYYVRPESDAADRTQFNIFARSFGLSNSIFKYDNNKGVILACDEGNIGSAILTDEESCVE